ncbi:MAG: hypothetical protein Q7S98_02190, partial [Deltaproteobacteria bacterium]|nr:hypothetical protein [Deltaproteobacteria bacterium]
MKKQKLLALVLLAAIFSACEDSPAPRQFVGKKIVSLASPIKRAEKVDTAGALAKMEEIYVRSKTDISFGGRRRGSGTNSPLQPGLIQVLSNGWGVSGKQVTRLYRTGLLDRYLHLHPEVLLGYDFEKLFPSYFGRLFLCRDCRINTIQSKTQFLTGQSTNPAITGTGTQPDVAYDPDHQHYLIVWNEKSDNDGSLIYARLVDRDGVTTLFGFDRKLISTPRGANGCLQSDFTDTTGLSMPTDCKENLEPSVAYNGGRFFIVWTLKGKAAHPAETPFSVILGEMVDALTLNPIVDSQAGDIWAGGRIVSKVFLYSNRSDCVRDQPCAPRNNREIQSWSSHEKPQLIPFVGENSFFTVWQTNRDFISCRDTDRWSSRSVYGRVIDFNFGPGRTNKDLVRIYSDRSNNANDPDHPEYATQCAAKVDVTTVNNPRVAINQRTRKVLTVFETHKNEAGPPSSISGQLFTFNGSRDVQSGLDPWNAIPVYSQDGNSFNPDVVDFDDKFLVANDLNKTSLVLQIFGTSENRLQRIGEPVTQEVRDDSVAKKARRPRLLVASDGNFVVSYEKRARVDDLPAQIEMTSLSSSLSPIGERVTLIGADSEGETYPTNVFQELASGQRDLLTVWLGQRTVRDQV